MPFDKLTRNWCIARLKARSRKINSSESGSGLIPSMGTRESLVKDNHVYVAFSCL